MLLFIILVLVSCQTLEPLEVHDYTAVTWLNGRWTNKSNGQFENWVSEPDGRIEHVKFVPEDGEQVTLSKRKIMRSGKNMILLNTVYHDTQSEVNHLLLTRSGEGYCLFENSGHDGIKSIGFRKIDSMRTEVQTYYFKSDSPQINYLERLN